MQVRLPLNRHIATIIAIAVTQAVYCENLVPQNAGEKMRYDTMIEMQKAYVSGICVMARDNGCINGSIFNEFGISALDFRYDTRKEKVRIVDINKMMNKWRIKNVMKKDLKQVIKNLEKGNETYENKKYKIKYEFNKQNDQ